MDKKLIIRYMMLIIGVGIMSMGISLSIKATLGTSPISCVPAVLCLAFPLTVGEFTILFNALLVIFQMVLLRKITISQIAQMLICVLFGYMIDFSLGLIGFINPASFGIMKSTESLVMVYLGGMGSLSGSVLSAVVFTILLELLRPAQILKWVIIPLILILIMEFHPEGIMGSKELTQVFPRLKKLFPVDKNLVREANAACEGGAA